MVVALRQRGAESFMHAAAPEERHALVDDNFSPVESCGHLLGRAVTASIINHDSVQLHPCCRCVAFQSREARQRLLQTVEACQDCANGHWKVHGLPPECSGRKFKPDHCLVPEDRSLGTNASAAREKANKCRNASTPESAPSRSGLSEKQRIMRPIKAIPERPQVTRHARAQFRPSK